MVGMMGKVRQSAGVYALGTIQSTAVCFQIFIAFDYEKRVLSCSV